MAKYTTAPNGNVFYSVEGVVERRDANGNIPFCVMISGNRNAGKSFSAKLYCITDSLKHGQKFCFIYRYQTDMDGVNKIFTDIENDPTQRWKHFKNWSVKKSMRQCYDIYMDGKHVGYTVCLNLAGKVKDISARLSDTRWMFMDEFQSEDGKYITDEFAKLESVSRSIARGKGKYLRSECRLMMCSNFVTVLNPYYVATGVDKRLKSDTKLMRGNGWVLEIVNNEGAKKGIEESALGQFFAGTAYSDSANENKFLHDCMNFVDKNIKGTRKPLCNLVHHGETYGIWVITYRGEKVYYVNHKYDPNFPLKFCYSMFDHTEDINMISGQYKMFKYLLDFFNAGKMKFEDLRCKNVFLDIFGLGVV